MDMNFRKLYSQSRDRTLLEIVVLINLPHYKSQSLRSSQVSTYLRAMQVSPTIDDNGTTYHDSLRAKMYYCPQFYTTHQNSQIPI